MPPRHRLSRVDFTRMRGLKRVTGEFFSISFGTLSGRRYPGAACVVSSKNAPRAVDRNRLKRVCRAALPPFLRAMSETQVVVLHAKQRAAGATSERLVQEINILMQKIGIIA